MQRLRMASAGMLLVSLMCRMAYSVCPHDAMSWKTEVGQDGRMGKWRRVISS